MRFKLQRKKHRLKQEEMLLDRNINILTDLNGNKIEIYVRGDYT